MIDRINLLLKNKNISARQFAEEIGIQPSGMSHILSGRNNPSLDFVMKVMTRWPEININWLLFGKGEMYEADYSKELEADNKTESSVDNNQQEPKEYDLFSQPTLLDGNNTKSVESKSPLIDKGRDTERRSNIRGKETSGSNEYPESVKNTVLSNVEDKNPRDTDKAHENRVKQSPLSNDSIHANVVHKKIDKVVVLYADHTFVEYYPE